MELPDLLTHPEGVGTYNGRVKVFRHIVDGNQVTLFDMESECVIVTPHGTHTLPLGHSSAWTFESVIDAYRKLSQWQEISYTCAVAGYIITVVNLEGCSNEDALTGLTEMSPVGYDIDTVPATLAYVKGTEHS